MKKFQSISKVSVPAQAIAPSWFVRLILAIPCESTNATISARCPKALGLDLSFSFVLNTTLTILFYPRRFQSVFLTLLLIQTCAAAADLEVDNVRGSDRQSRVSGQKDRTAYKTISRAVADAAVGDKIVIRKTGTPYRECVSISTNHRLGTLDFPLIIEGNDATLDGTQPLSVDNWSTSGRDLFELNRRSPGFVTILAASDQPIPENIGQLADLSKLQPFQYARNNGSIFFKVRRGDVPQTYGLRLGVEQTGLTLYDVSNIVIRNLNISGYRLDGINCHSLVTDVRFENVVVEYNGRSGISVGGASQVAFKAGKLEHNGQSQARAEGYSRLELIGTAIEPGKAMSIDQVGGRVSESQ